MASEQQQPREERGRILRFERRGPAAKRSDGPGTARPTEPPVEGLGRYAHAGDHDDYRQRMINNGLALVACAILIAIGIWLANSIAELRKSQDCALSGRSCTKVIVPPRIPN